MLSVRWHSQLKQVLVTAVGPYNTRLAGHAMSNIISDNKQTLQHMAQHSRERTQFS